MMGIEMVPANLKADVANLWRKYYPTYNPDDFAEQVASKVKETDEVLEIGAGSGRGMQASFPLKGRCKRYVGIDLDPRVTDNPNLDEGMLGDAAKLPFPDASFDLVFHKMVAEHLEHPLVCLQEANRVLKQGGRLMFETPNRFYYPMLIARMTPTSFHSFAVKKFGSGREASDVFPTFYRINDRKAIERLCKQAGFEAKVQINSLPPGYLRSHKLLFSLGVVYERTVEKAFPGLRGRMVVEAIKL